jgi:hypothetical protein
MSRAHIVVSLSLRTNIDSHREQIRVRVIEGKWTVSIVRLQFSVGTPCINLRVIHHYLNCYKRVQHILSQLMPLVSHSKLPLSPLRLSSHDSYHMDYSSFLTLFLHHPSGWPHFFNPSASSSCRACLTVSNATNISFASVEYIAAACSRRVAAPKAVSSSPSEIGSPLCVAEAGFFMLSQHINTVSKWRAKSFFIKVSNTPIACSSVSVDMVSRVFEIWSRRKVGADYWILYQITRRCCMEASSTHSVSHAGH